MANNRPYLFHLARAALVAALVGLSFSTQAWAVDAEALFEERCSGCHPKVEDLVKAELFIENGALCGRACGYDIRQFLPKHHGHPNAEEVAALYQLFFSHLKGDAIDLIRSRGGFQARCAICHDTERELARRYLVRDGDVVRSRYTGRELTEFLSTHGRINADELDFFVQLLTPLAPLR